MSICSTIDFVQRNFDTVMSISQYSIYQGFVLIPVMINQVTVTLKGIDKIFGKSL